jgi:hypothetical protein
MKWMLLIALVMTGCAGGEFVAEPRWKPGDKMAALCVTKDFSRHTDQQLSDCQRWLFEHGYYVDMPSPRAQMIVPAGGGAYLLLP